MIESGTAKTSGLAPNLAFDSESHGTPQDELVRSFASHPHDGLSHKMAAERLEQYGPNLLPSGRRQGPLLRLLAQFHSPLIYVLIVAMLITFAVGKIIDGLVIAAVVLINAFVGFVQERRAGEALNALATAVKSDATVVRSGEKCRINAQELVPGDLVVIEAGEKVPADLRLIAAQEMSTDESALTGESMSVSKSTGELDGSTALGDRVNMAFCGTLVIRGIGRGLVVATGMDTEIGRIHRLTDEAEGVVTPLTKRLISFSKWLTIVILLLAAVTLVVGILRGETPADMITAAVALAVGAIPEGLPAALTITLAIGASRMARRNAIVRKLPAAETLGSTTVICTDKTGTLTQNRMVVQYVFAHGLVHPVHVSQRDQLSSCLIAGALCNNASIDIDEMGELATFGDPTEIALLVAAQEVGMGARLEQSHGVRIDELPFTSESRLMATLHVAPDGDKNFLVVKGAAEAVLDLCQSQRSESGDQEPLERSLVESQVASFGEEALRVLAFASCEVPRNWRFVSGNLGDHPMTFLGLQAMSDPPRPEAIRAIAACHSAGIQVKMITGDHVGTASAIARQMGLNGDKQDDCVVMTGEELAQFGPLISSTQLEAVDVFARVSAEQKLLIVRTLQAGGHVVAMTGDGINDAPALRQADIGIAMGFGGTEVAKEASDMVLTDDNFATIEAAIEEGRSIFDNLTKFLTWTLPTNMGEGLVVLAAIVAGIALPIIPVQILWINMTTAILLGLMLAFEAAEPDIMNRPPRRPNKPILTAVLIRRMVTVAAIMLVGTFGLFEWFLNQGAELDQARTITVNAFVAMEIGYVFNCRVLNGPVTAVNFFSNRLLIMGVLSMAILQIAYTYLPAMNYVFQSSPLSWEQWVVILALGLAVYFIVEIEKWITFHVSRSSHMNARGGPVSSKWVVTNTSTGTGN